MRYVFIAILALLVILLIIFLIQNLAFADLAFLAWKIRMPIALVVLGSFLLGGVIGGVCLTLFKALVAKVN